MKVYIHQPSATDTHVARTDTHIPHSFHSDVYYDDSLSAQDSGFPQVHRTTPAAAPPPQSTTKSTQEK